MAGEAMTEKSQTEELREALAQLPVRQMCCRAAEYAALIRYRRPTAAAEDLCEHLRPGLERRGCLPESDDPIDTLTVCPSCPGAFLRGLFISLGTMPDPEKGCRMEFPLPNERARDEVLSVFDTLGIEPRVSHRRGRPLVYLGGSDAIEDILGIMGATREVFDFINAKIKREIRNNVNRATNCDAANIRRTVSASEEQICAIELLRDGVFGICIGICVRAGGACAGAQAAEQKRRAEQHGQNASGWFHAVCLLVCFWRQHIAAS